MENFGKKSKAASNPFFNIVAATDMLIAPVEKTIRFASNIPAYFDLWVQRANHRRQLMVLDERLLSDIGLTRADAIREAKKPFWKA